MAAFPQTVTSQEPVDLGSGFEDPMDPCTMCMQGQQEIQQAYNELTQSCNACQTQQNLTNLQQQGCQGCAQAQQVIQKVQQQSGGCSSCGQPTHFQPMAITGQPMLTSPTGTFSTQPMTASQGLVQPMLTPLVGTGQNQILTTISQQPGMTAGQLPIALERGPTSQQIVQPHFVNGQLSSVPTTTQPMITGMLTQPSMPVQQPMQPVNIPPPPATPAPVMQPVMTPVTPSPVQQPVMQPAPPPPPPAPPVMQPAPTFNVPALTPAQIAAAQQIAQAATPQFTPSGGLAIGGIGGATQGYGAGGGKAGPGAATTIGVGPEGLSYNFGSGFTVNIGGGITGVGAPGAFDVHRPDLHKGGPWHFVMPLGTDAIFNLL